MSRGETHRRHRARPWINNEAWLKNKICVKAGAPRVPYSRDILMDDGDRGRSGYKRDTLSSEVPIKTGHRFIVKRGTPVCGCIASYIDWLSGIELNRGWTWEGKLANACRLQRCTVASARLHVRSSRTCVRVGVTRAPLVSSFYFARLCSGVGTQLHLSNCGGEREKAAIEWERGRKSSRVTAGALLPSGSRVIREVR